MCTLVVALGAIAGVPLAVSANRNEFLARPAQGFSLWPEEIGKPRIAAPRDLQSGGTWQGINQRGLFACITNRHGAQISQERRSRGELVAAVLERATLEEARSFCTNIAGERYNGFHLFVSDRHQALLAVGDGAHVELRELQHGLHLITERSFGAGEGEREGKVRAEFAALIARAASGGDAVHLDALRLPLTRHGDPSRPLEAACVHAETFGYGTRSSLQLLFTESGPPRGLFTDGHPCEAAPVDISALLAALFDAGSASSAARRDR